MLVPHVLDGAGMDVQRADICAGGGSSNGCGSDGGGVHGDGRESLHIFKLFQRRVTAQILQITVL